MIQRSLVFLLTMAGPLMAQNESRLHRDFRVEGQALKKCGQFSFGNLTDCGQTLVMGQPVHIAVGSLSPQNGFGAGLAFVEHKNFASEWRDNWDIDAVATTNGSWRAGGYMKAYRLAGGTIHMSSGAGGPSTSRPLFTSAPLFNFYSQSISLKHVDYYGLGPNSSLATHATFGFGENVTGANAILPLGGVFAPAKMSLAFELNGRFPSIQPGPSGEPSVYHVFNEANTPGLAKQTGYFQPAEGMRVQPAFFKDHLRLNYFVNFEQYIAPANSTYSFRRWNGDFTHTIPLYGRLNARSSPYNGPDDCTGPGSKTPARPCPPVSTQTLQGSITLRAFLSESFADNGSHVPFYLMPTIGGSDINGTQMLATYKDYRFRAPDLILFQGTIEHSLGKLPVGALFSADAGKIALRRSDVEIDHLRHTFSAGITVHAGGLPVISVVYAWGGPEGTHPIATVDPNLLGGSSRPSLF